ncbi:MAG TPA: OmpA family protein [Allosphingosinicella sp.]|jgi:outer membrane protein OmpA-like peptidoglycan-associated protein
MLMKSVAALIALAALSSPAGACVVQSQIFFATASAEIDRAAATELDRFAASYVSGAAGTRLHLFAASDTAGSAASNLALARRRGEEVQHYLAGRGIPLSDIRVVARGESELQIPTADGVSEPRNRVVVVRANPTQRPELPTGRPVPIC